MRVLGYSFSPWAQCLGGCTGLPLTLARVFLMPCPVTSLVGPLPPRTTHYSPEWSLCHPWRVRSRSTLLRFPTHQRRVSDLSIRFYLRELSAPSLSLEQCLCPGSGTGMSIYNTGTSQPSSITAWLFPCDVYCIQFYSFFYTFSRLYNSNNIIQIIIA